MHPEIRRYYEEAFQNVNYSGTSGFATNFTHSRIEKRLGKDSSFPITLELGSAHAEHFSFVKHSFKKYIMLDLEDFKLDLNSLKGDDKNFELVFLQASAEDIPLEDSSVDRVLHSCLLHHLNNPEQCLMEIRRVLRNNGIYTAYVPCSKGIFYSFFQSLTTKRKINHYLKKNDFSISIGYLEAIEHPNHYHGITGLIREVFKHDSIKEKHFPFNFKSFNCNFFTVFSIQINKSN